MLEVSWIGRAGLGLGWVGCLSTENSVVDCAKVLEVAL